MAHPQELADSAWAVLLQELLSLLDQKHRRLPRHPAAVRARALGAIRGQCCYTRGGRIAPLHMKHMPATPIQRLSEPVHLSQENNRFHHGHRRVPQASFSYPGYSKAPAHSHRDNLPSSGRDTASFQSVYSSGFHSIPRDALCTFALLVAPFQKSGQ